MMNAVECAIEKVKDLDEFQARALLAWLEVHPPRPKLPVSKKGAKAMVGFARRVRKEPRTTESWMEELRAGER